MLDRLHSVLRSIRERHERRLAIRALSRLDDHQLADIGIERGSVVDAVEGRLDVFERSMPRIS